MKESDNLRLEEAAQATTFAWEAIRNLMTYAGDPLLEEHAYNLLEPIAAVKTRLERLLNITADFEFAKKGGTE